MPHYIIRNRHVREEEAWNRCVAAKCDAVVVHGLRGVEPADRGADALGSGEVIKQPEWHEFSRPLRASSRPSGTGIQVSKQMARDGWQQQGPGGNATSSPMCRAGEPGAVANGELVQVGTSNHD